MPYPTFSRAVEGFLLHKSAVGRSKNTLRNYSNHLTRFAEWVGDIPIDEITSDELEEFLAWLRTDFSYSRIGSLSIKPRRLSPKTLRNAWATLSSFWKWASNEFEIVDPFDIPSPRAPSKPVTPLTKEEIERLLQGSERSASNARRPTARRDKALLLLFLDTGVRVSELCGSDIGDLDLERGRLFVTGKGEKRRFVYLGKASQQALWSYQAERYPNESPDSDEPLFTSRDGWHRLTRHNVRNLVGRIGSKVGIAGVHPHRFRHTFAIEFLRNGGDVFSLQHLLGHSSLEMVRNYLRIAELDIERIQMKASPVDNWRLR